MERICCSSASGRKHYILLIYDISDNRRRIKISKLLEGYGKRVQMSAFECFLNTKQYDKLVHSIHKIAKKDDNIRIYDLQVKDVPDEIKCDIYMI